MEEKLVFLFSKLLQVRPEESSEINSELNSIYNDADALSALFSLFQPKYKKDIRTLSGITIKTTLKNVLHLLTESDLAIIKQSFIDIFQSENDFDTINIVIEAASVIFDQWPEIFDFLQSLIDEGSDKSYQLAMSISSNIPEELYNQSTEKFVEMCTTLITISLDDQTNCRAALALFSSISHFVPISKSLSKSFPNFFVKFLDVFQEYLIVNDSSSFSIASQLEKSIESIEIEDTSPLLNFLIDLGNNAEINNHYKVPILNVIDSILKKRIVTDLFENILQIAIECSSSLFDNYCYIENEATQVSFHFLKHFVSIEDFESIFLKNLKTDSNASIFASLLALSSILSESDEITSQIPDSYLSYILSSCEIQNHSILELSFSIFLNIDFDFVSEEMTNKIVIVTLNNCMPSSGHSELHEIIIKLIVSFLFFKKISVDVSDDVFAMLLALYEQEQSFFIRDQIILCFAGMIKSFGTEKVETMLPTFVPLLIESSKSFNSQCIRSQAAAVESLSFCASKFPDHFNDLLAPFTSFLLTWIDEIDDRQHVESSLYSLQRLIFSGNLTNAETLTNVLQIIIKYIDVSEPNHEIDDSGISFEEIQINCLNFICKLAKFLFFNEKVKIDPDFFINILPSLASSLCKLVISEIEYQNKVIETIFSICQSCYKIEPTIVFAFCDFFMNIFDDELNLSTTFFYNIFKSNIEVSYPDDFFESIYSKSLQILNEGSNQIISLFIVMSNKFDVFPIDQFIEIINKNSTQLSSEDTSNSVYVFYNYMNHNAITQDNSSTVTSIMSISFDALHLCTNYSIKPSPIKLLSLLINFQIDFNDQIVSQFYPIFIKIFNNCSDPDLQTEYLNETLCESILFLLKVIVLLPKVDFPFELFFPKIFYFLPFTENFSSNSEILTYLTKLPSSSRFSKLSPYFDDLFSCLVRTISLNEDTICEIGIEIKTFKNVVKFTFEMLRAQESRIEIIKDIADGNQEKIENIQNRLNNFANDPNFLQLN